MNIKTTTDALKRALSAASKAVAPRSPLPVLTGVLLSTNDDGQVRVASTDLEIGITTHIPAYIEQPGQMCLPAKLLSDVIGGLPNGNVTLVWDIETHAATVTCGRFRSTIKGYDPQDFPSVPHNSDGGTLATFWAADLRRAIDQVALAAATDDSRPVLTGVLFRLKDEIVTLVAADSFRLAVRTLLPPDGYTQSCMDDHEYIIPARALSEWSSITGKHEPDALVSIGVRDTQIVLDAPGVSLVSRIIDGKFPNFERIIPQQHTTRVLVDTAVLRKAVKHAALFAQQEILKLTVTPGTDGIPGKVTVAANTWEVGDSTVEVDAIVNGDGGQIALNAKFLEQCLGAIGTGQAAMEMQDAEKPAVFHPVGQEDAYTHIVMPMSIR